MILLRRSNRIGTTATTAATTAATMTAAHELARLVATNADPATGLLDPPTVATPAVEAERVVAEVDRCRCGGHIDQHRVRVMPGTTGRQVELWRTCEHCPGQCRGFARGSVFQRRVARELRLLRGCG